MKTTILLLSGLILFICFDNIAQTKISKGSPYLQQGLSKEAIAKADSVFFSFQNTPMQQKLKNNSEVYVGAVYWQPGNYDPAKLLWEFKRMREVGFNVVRFHNIPPVWTGPGKFDFSKADEWIDLATKAGLKVIYMSGTPGDIPKSVFDKYGLTKETYDLLDWSKDTRCQAIISEYITALVNRYKSHPGLYSWAIGGEPGSAKQSLDNDIDKQGFIQWLTDHYGTVENLEKTWNFDPGDTMVTSFEDAWKESLAQKNFRRTGSVLRDKTRYLIDKSLNRENFIAGLYQKLDNIHPTLNGSHQLLYNQASLAWDNSQHADNSDQHFSSIHLAWHFEPVFGEFIRPSYMMSRLTHDYSKKPWTSCFETTGGPVQYSGGYPNSMTPGLMRSLMLNYLAGGNRAIAFWTWNHRTGGIEAGEYGMTTYSGEVAPWTIEAGKIANGMFRYKKEIWDARQDLEVGLLQEWDNDFVYSVESDRYDNKDGVSEYTRGSKSEPLNALIGVSRACINNHVPYEYVTGDEIGKGLAARYPCIYAPHIRAISKENITALTEYVKAGGRLIADVEFAFFDPWSKMHPKGKGSQMEQLFGAWIDMIHDTRTGEKSLGSIDIKGLYGDIKLTNARVISSYTDGTPAITECRLGRGTAVLIGFAAAKMCHLQANSPKTEALITQLIESNVQKKWQCSAPMAYCLRTMEADHYFLLNDGAEQPAFINVYDSKYASGTDVITGKPVDVNGTISVTIPKESAMWLRFEKLK